MTLESILHRLVTNPRIESELEEIGRPRYIGETLRGSTVCFDRFEAIKDLLYKGKSVYLVSYESTRDIR